LAHVIQLIACEEKKSKPTVSLIAISIACLQGKSLIFTGREVAEVPRTAFG